MEPKTISATTINSGFLYTPINLTVPPGIDISQITYPTEVHTNPKVKEIFSQFKVPKIKNVIYNDPATIVFWYDGTKTVVKAGNGDVYNPEVGLAMAIAKKALGNKGNYNNVMKKWLPKE